MFLIQYWVQQEILSPELLPYFDVSKIQDALKGQLDSIQDLKKDLSKHNKQRDTQYLTLHVIELERIQYFYQQYLRTRMLKLISNAFYYYNNIGEYQISLKEKEFLKALVEKKLTIYSQIKFWSEIGQSKLIIQSQQDDKINVQKPDVNQYVVIHVNTSRTIHVGSIALSENDSALVSYDDIKQLSYVILRFMVPIKSVTLI
ncbi:unnamed protein product (macronuclear) [Paramecium tetraurelia]|uniref:DNA replication complex GINS protein SLD5 n=1 Tax=Paramecium tetraurelia TaxID=5888 RepID=A0D3B1_PARTE|nr:uncharacterized protein GSPATT00013013001 [Paramecium tetraurelia]CAK77528.1 unnamed protein product [Paramecium tetraurelia]|eukprot:XP_001444925.1 hypothetical protein (macronuclear) [Paramecium tetraurelia strain d4-2]